MKGPWLELSIARRISSVGKITSRCTLKLCIQYTIEMPQHLSNHLLGSVSFLSLEHHIILISVLLIVYDLISIVSCRMDIQRCRIEGCTHQMGFMDPTFIN